MLPHCGLDNYNLKEFKSEFMKTLYVSDMDGTLLGTDSRVSCETAEIVSGLSRCGTAITVATARTPATVDVLLEDTYTSIPAIVMTGGGAVGQGAQALSAPCADGWKCGVRGGGCVCGRGCRSVCL